MKTHVSQCHLVRTARGLWKDSQQLLGLWKSLGHLVDVKGWEQRLRDAKVEIDNAAKELGINFEDNVTKQQTALEFAKALTAPVQVGEKKVQCYWLPPYFLGEISSPPPQDGWVYGCVTLLQDMNPSSWFLRIQCTSGGSFTLMVDDLELHEAADVARHYAALCGKLMNFNAT